MIRISIVMAYYNRLPHLTYTLKTLLNTSLNKSLFEIVIVDDFSNTENSLENIQEEFSELNINIINMENEMGKKDYYNPCIPFNYGFRNAEGEKIIIQNPECAHTGDILSVVDKELIENKYLVFGCYACSENEVDEVRKHGNVENKKGEWYQHTTHRKSCFHFTSAIMKSDLCDLNGFDERFAYGKAFDDSEFLLRIKRKNMDIKMIDDPYSIHQWHYNIKTPDNSMNIKTNSRLYNEAKKESIIKANNEIDICQ